MSNRETLLNRLFMSKCKIAILLPLFFLTSCTKPQALDDQKAAVSENDVIVVNKDQSTWVSDRIICCFDQADVGRMVTMNKTIDKKPIEPYLVTLKVNSKNPYKNSEARVKAVKDGKRYKLATSSSRSRKLKLTSTMGLSLLTMACYLTWQSMIPIINWSVWSLVCFFRQRPTLARPRNLAMSSHKLSALVGRWGPQPLWLKVRAILQIPYQMHSDKSAKSLCDVMTGSKIMWDYV